MEELYEERRDHGNHDPRGDKGFYGDAVGIRLAMTDADKQTVGVRLSFREAMAIAKAMGEAIHAIHGRMGEW